RERRERLERGDDREDRRDRDSRYRDEDWRDRVRRDREDRRDRGERIEIEIPESASEQGRLRLEVEPEDASVYLDGRFVGTGQELGSLRRGLLVEPGRHRIAVVRPGRESAEKEFEVEAGEEVDLEIELETAGER
ncbi:MAG TPA: PEGA domain-containing protein, partial [Thermoanaerobaculia bacterium]|nr:PEGA domain-containing protein [Thermoanaerobaculia bacterium]